MIWVDCDGVLADFTTLYLELLHRVTGRQHTHEEVTRFQFEECVSSPEENDKVWRLLDSQPGLVTALADLPGAPNGLSQLRLLGKVGCLTSPHLGPHWMPERAAWLRYRGFSRHQIVFASDKSHVIGEMMVDDKYENCAEWSRKNKKLSILLTRPWNARHDLKGNKYVKRAADWTHVVQLAKSAIRGTKGGT